MKKDSNVKGFYQITDRVATGEIVTRDPLMALLGLKMCARSARRAKMSRGVCCRCDLVVWHYISASLWQESKHIRRICGEVASSRGKILMQFRRNLYVETMTSLYYQSWFTIFSWVRSCIVIGSSSRRLPYQRVYENRENEKCVKYWSHSIYILKAHQGKRNGEK